MRKFDWTKNNHNSGKIKICHTDNTEETQQKIVVNLGTHVKKIKPLSTDGCEFGGNALSRYEDAFADCLNQRFQPFFETTIQNLWKKT